MVNKPSMIRLALIGCGEHAEKYRVRRRVALAVVVEEEEHLVLHDGSTEIAAELIEVIETSAGDEDQVFDGH